MKKILLLLIFISFLIGPVFAQTLTGKITYTIDSARNEVFHNAKMAIPLTEFKHQLFDPDFEENKNFIKYGIQPKYKSIEVFKKGAFKLAYAIVYERKPDYAYYYLKLTGGLVFIDIYSKPKNKNQKYPSKCYRYDTDGKLTGAALVVSDEEAFLYDKKGELITHRVGNIGYDKNGKKSWVSEEVEF